MRQVVLSSILVLALSGCAAAMSASIDGEPTAIPAASTVEPSSEPAAEPAKTQAPGVKLDPADRPPARAESEFATDFSKHSVPYDEILSGGP
ncbi:MAG: hypothetical protein PVJ55_04440, partial [Anaerolineae bacterium]